MQGIEQIAYQNACATALSLAEQNNVPYYVFRDADGRLNYSDDPAVVPASEVIYTANPEG